MIQIYNHRMTINSRLYSKSLYTNHIDSQPHNKMKPTIVQVEPSTAKKRKRKQASHLPKMNFHHQYKSPQQLSQDSDQRPSNKQVERNSQGKLRGVDEQTVGEIQNNGLPQPYEFLSQRVPSLLTIFIPRFACKSITFILSVFYVIMFIVLIAYNYSQPQTETTWNCSLYKLQVKYYPKLRFSMQLWRVIISSFFHSNFAHFFLNLFGLQIYGYFVEWHYGKLKYSITIICALIYAHFFSALLQKSTISTTPSSILFAILVLKCFFFWEYRNYRRLLQRKAFLYILLGLVAGLNLIPIFVVNNVDYSATIGGVIVGLFFGLIFWVRKGEQGMKRQALVSVVLLVLVSSFIVLVWGCLGMMVDDQYRLMGEMIQTRC